MPTHDPVFWPDLLRRTLSAYDEPLLRQVAARLIRPRNQWPVAELIDRCVAAVENPAVIDRRRADLDADPRRLLALIGHSRQPTWDLGNLVEMMLALGCPDGLQPVFALLQAGLLFPRLPEGGGTVRIKTFEQWLAFPGATGLAVFTPPLIASRAVGEDLGLPDLSSKDEGGRMKDEGRREGASGSSFILHPSSLQPAALDHVALLQQVGGDEGLLAELVTVFRADSARLREEIAAALGRGDARAVERAAHTLKGLVRFFGASAAAEEALRLERMGRAGDLAGGREALARLTAEGDRLLAALPEGAGDGLEPVAGR